MSQVLNHTYIIPFMTINHQSTIDTLSAAGAVLVILSQKERFLRLFLEIDVVSFASFLRKRKEKES